MKKVLVTGASGFLGVNLVRMLIRENYDVRILVREKADLHMIEDLSPEIFYGNIDSSDDVFRSVDGCEIVIHAAGLTAQHGISFEQYEQINVTATKLVAEACLRYKIEKLVYVSTANTFAPGSITFPGTELNGFSYFKAGSGYINSKYLAQQFVLEQVLQRKLPAVVINPSFMIGSGDIKPSSGQLILYALNKKILFYPPGGKNFVHVLDVCRGITQAIHHGKNGNCYLIAGENLSYRNFFRMLIEITGQNTLLIKIPPFILKTGAIVSSLIQLVNRRSQRLTRTNAFLLCQKNYYSGKKAEVELGLKYSPAKDAIKDACDWFTLSGKDIKSK